MSPVEQVSGGQNNKKPKVTNVAIRFLFPVQLFFNITTNQWHLYFMEKYNSFLLI